MNLFFRKIIGYLAVPIFPGYSGCKHCHRPWAICKWHTTEYSDDGSGCFPLCQDCWAELNPAERLPYYMALVTSWQREGEEDHHGQPWHELRATLAKNVLDGK